MRIVPIASLLVLAVSGLACDSSVETTSGSGGSGAQSSGNAGSGNGSGTGAAGGSTGEGASGTSTASTGTGGASGTLCDDVCAHFQSLNCEQGGDGCAEQCNQAAAQAPRCVTQFNAILQCAMELSVCDLDASCEAQLDAWEGCATATGCGPEECSGTGSSGGEQVCGCSAVCQDQPVNVDCSISAGGQASCQCSVNGQIVGECVEPDPSFCDVQDGCCAQFF